MVTIVEPNIKKDNGYHIYSEAKAGGLFVKTVDGRTDYEGTCWPGTSSYLDFLNPAVRDYWAGKFNYSQYPGSSKDLFIWNDMNEPSVFSGPEITMPKDLVHFGGLEHREIHNIYGLYVHESTYRGLVTRSNGQLRPFILIRAFFVGSQRTAAVWTGDNTADWKHLQASVPMLLSLSIAGVPHVGADVGGFFKNPDPQLLTRWYQAGAFQPFFRAHAHIETKRREPWLFEEQYKNAIREAIRLRYSLLPYWYTLFHEHSITGWPVMRPLWAEFPEDETGYNEERQWLVGNALLVRPVMDPDVHHVSVYLPGRDQVWYEWTSSTPLLSPATVQVAVTINSIPLYQRGGTIIPVRERVRRASILMRDDPITLYIALDKREFANGIIYLDDGETFDYKNGQYAYWGFEFKKEKKNLYVLCNKNLDKKGILASVVFIEKIVIRGLKFTPKSITMQKEGSKPVTLMFSRDQEAGILTIRKPTPLVTEEFRIEILYP